MATFNPKGHAMNLFAQLLLALVAAASATFALLWLGPSNPWIIGLVIAAATCLTPIVARLFEGSYDYDDHSHDHDSGDHGHDSGHSRSHDHSHGHSRDHLDADREVGEVKWFNVSKGFGFIRRDNGDEVFVHFRSIRNQKGKRMGLKEGQRVSFVVTDSSKGPQAEDVEAQ